MISEGLFFCPGCYSKLPRAPYLEHAKSKGTPMGRMNETSAEPIYRVQWVNKGKIGIKIKRVSARRTLN